MTQKDVKRLMNNKNTRVLVEWLGQTLQFSNKMVISNEFFHPTHSQKDRELLITLLMNFFDKIEKIEKYGKDGVFITLK